MALIQRRGVRRRRGLRAFTVRRCPRNGFQVGPCRLLCTPHNGQGLCGREAPHALVGRHQRAIALTNSRRWS